MQDANTRKIITEALEIADEMNPQDTDGTWLEDVTVQAGPHIKEWDIARCYPWSEWPDREKHFPNTSKQDIGIDAVGIRRSDGQHIAIQCKARQLNAAGEGANIHKTEVDKFTAASTNPLWAERWIVTNGNSQVSGNAEQVMSMSDPKRPIKLVNIHSDLKAQHDAGHEEPSPHLDPDGAVPKQTKSSMQEEAVAESVRILREHERSESGGLPVGEARGKIILPCGTGKTRISLRIIEELTPKGALSIVLCPSIALVAQIRREYLQNTTVGVRALAVCSDETAGYDPQKESVRNTAKDPTADNSNVSASEVKGKVTTDAKEIADWIEQGEGADINVIFGTYQSSHKVSEALHLAGARVTVLVADEAHRTAGLRRKRSARKSGQLSDEEQRIRDFTLCHDNDAFPATYRVYQTATPRIYDKSRISNDASSDWMVRSMDDETVFGVVLYRKSYVEAVNNGWLADYRIIALAINDPEAYAEANALASNTRSSGRSPLTSTNYLRGLAFALAMGGATQDRDNSEVVIKSCIAFMNTVDKSKNMAEDLRSKAVHDWVQKWLHENRQERQAAYYNLEHLDATSNVTAREAAKLKLAQASEQQPHGIINVGIFGEGTDSPSLSAVAFLEPRKSPIDVVQAVGRAMRTAPGKKVGYIICPILIPPNADPERWLMTSSQEEGWEELGQILLALRAHDQRIEDQLSQLLHLYIPSPPDVERTIVAVASGEEKRIQYRQIDGALDDAKEAVERVLDGKRTLAEEFDPITEIGREAPLESQSSQSAMPNSEGPFSYPASGGHQSTTAPGKPLMGEAKTPELRLIEPSQIVTGKKNEDGSIELRMSTVARTKSAPDGTPGNVDIKKTKAKAKEMINKGTGIRLPQGSQERKPRRTREEAAEQSAMQMLQLTGMGEHGSAIKMNLLSKSGLSDDRIMRDLNILEAGIKEASHHLLSDGLAQTLDKHFGLDKRSTRSKQADGS